MKSQEQQQFYKPEIEQASRDQLEHLQWASLKKLLETVFKHNTFYRNKYSSAGVADWQDLATTEDFFQLPFTSREELSEDQLNHAPYGTNKTWPMEEYTHWYRTSGRTGTPLKVLLTREDWISAGETWCYNFAGVGLSPKDSLYIPFSFGPYAGLWGAVSGAEGYGLLMIPGGGQKTLERIHFIREIGPAGIACIPTYALRIVETAIEKGIDLESAGVNALILGGEPGASVPATRARIESNWGVKAYDSTGQTEVGHHGFECIEQNGVHMIESSYLVEVFKPGADEPVPEGEVGEMVITTLSRTGMPIIRYRTNDLVRLTTEPCSCGRTFARLEGGILGRVDEMVTVRGINVYPTAIEDCLMDFSEISEFQVDIFEDRGMKEIKIRIEPDAPNSHAENGQQLSARVEQELRHRLALRAKVEVVEPGTLERPPGKAYRFTLHP